MNNSTSISAYWRNEPARQYEMNLSSSTPLVTAQTFWTSYSTRPSRLRMEEATSCEGAPGVSDASNRCIVGPV